MIKMGNYKVKRYTGLGMDPESLQKLLNEGFIHGFKFKTHIVTEDSSIFIILEKESEIQVGSEENRHFVKCCLNCKKLIAKTERLDDSFCEIKPDLDGFDYICNKYEPDYIEVDD